MQSCAAAFFTAFIGFLFVFTFVLLSVCLFLGFCLFVSPFILLSVCLFVCLYLFIV